MAHRTDSPHQHPTPHRARNCKLCGALRHPAQAAAGRALTAHLAEHPLPRQQAVNA
jgi:hypothetical protein